MHIVTGCLHPTPMNYLRILAGIQPTGLSRQGATISLACQSDGTKTPTLLLNGMAVHKDLDTPLCLQHTRCPMNYLN